MAPNPNATRPYSTSGAANFNTGQRAQSPTLRKYGDGLRCHSQFRNEFLTLEEFESSAAARKLTPF